MLLFRGRDAPHNYMLAALHLNLAVLWALGGGELAVAHIESLRSVLAKNKAAGPSKDRAIATLHS